MEQHFAKFPNKGSTSRGIARFSKNFSRKVFLPSHLTPGIFRIFGWTARISGIQQFPEFMETFPGKFCIICRYFQFFESFGWMESAQKERFSFSPKFLKFRLEIKWNEFDSVRPEYLGPPLLLYRWFTLTARLILVGQTEMSLSIWQNCCPQYRSSSSRLQGQGLTRITTKCVVAWVGSEQPECTVPLGTYPA